MDDILKEFLVESYENMDRLDRDLVALEKEPHGKEILASIFRTIHTLKGGSGFLGLGNLERVAHAGENLLSKLRDGVIVITPELTNALLATVDAIRYMLSQIEASGKPGDRDFKGLIALLNQLTECKAGATPMTSPTGEVSESFWTGSPTAAADKIAETTVPSRSSQNLKTDCGSISESALNGNSNARTIVTKVSSNSPAVEPEAALAELAEGRSNGISDSTIRVDVGLLDKLMDLVGELVLARNQMLQFNTRRTDSAFLATSQRLNLITTELQGNVMKTRMQPIGKVWAGLPRLVRDLATNCGKEVRIEMLGKETELDKTIIEAIKDPLTHIVRNSIDHGIEIPDTRVLRGKPEEGCLKIRAFHEGGQVNIEISDDGGGVDFEAVKQRAVQRGLITPEQSAQMSDQEALHLLFLPGFSTAKKVTNVSGRGVGMDVVKTNIEKIGGTVDLQSQPGAGTTLRIKIPLTLAIIPALIITSGGDRFAIPQVSLLELVRMESEQARLQIESIHGAPVYRLRGQLLPLVYLNQELKIEGKSGADAGAVKIVVLQADGRPFGLVVDEINDTQEIVVKPLGKQLKGVACFVGATIMGDGRVALILDVLGLAQSSGVVAEVRERSIMDKSNQARSIVDPRQPLLLFEAGQGSRMAIPLAMVARLEEFPSSSIEHSGALEVVRYRGQILPLIRIARHVPATGPEPTDNEMLQVVVYSEQGRSVGLVVGRINDIVQETITAKRHSPGNGIFGSVVIQDKVTDLLDVQSIIRKADPLFYPTPVETAATL